MRYLFEFISTGLVKGLQSNDRIEIKSDLTDGEIVVVSSAYLLNSEYIVEISAKAVEGMKI